MLLLDFLSSLVYRRVEFFIILSLLSFSLTKERCTLQNRDISREIISRFEGYIVESSPMGPLNCSICMKSNQVYDALLLSIKIYILDIFVELNKCQTFIPFLRFLAGFSRTIFVIVRCNRIKNTIFVYIFGKHNFCIIFSMFLSILNFKN